MNFQILNPNSKPQATKALSALKKQYSGAKIALNYSNHIQLLVAVILSAQCTDKKVNEVTEKLFRKYKTVGDFANADKKTFEQEVKSCGFYKMKAKNIIASAKKIQKDFGGKLPRAMKEILTLPGVARKTANVVLGNAYGVTEGIAVDTHVMRLAQKFGLSKYKDPVRIERDLMAAIPKEEWFAFTYRLIDYGRAYCVARPHIHADCPLTVALSK